MKPDGVTAEPVNLHIDHRGVVFEPIGASALKRQSNVHVVLTEPGAIRGNHRHLRGTEILVVTGPARVCWKISGTVEALRVPEKAVWRLVIPPGIAHAIENTDEQAHLLVAFNTVAHDPGQTDTISDPVL